MNFGRRIKAESLLVFVALIWGSTFVVVKEALEDASPLPFLAVRFTLAGVVLLLVMSRGGVARSAVIPGLLLGVFLFGGVKRDGAQLPLFVFEKFLHFFFDRHQLLRARL